MLYVDQLERPTATTLFCSEKKHSWSEDGHDNRSTGIQQMRLLDIARVEPVGKEPTAGIRITSSSNSTSCNGSSFDSDGDGGDGGSEMRVVVGTDRARGEIVHVLKQAIQAVNIRTNTSRQR